jgi:hypothetical protein
VRCFHLKGALRLGNNGDFDTVIVPGQGALSF